MDDPARPLDTYLTERDPAVFGDWARRHLDLVYSAARRHARGDPHQAQEITQMVFLTALRHAARLARHPAPLAWLHQTTRHAASELRRAEARRLARETRAATDPALAPDVNSAEAPADWSRVEPLLDDALATLGERDREAVLLRYFANQPYAAIAATLGLAENTARVRTDRALEKLRRALAIRGVTSTASALGLALGAHAVSAAPASVATSVLATTVSFGTGATAASFVFMNFVKYSAIAVLAATLSGIAVYHAASRPAHAPVSGIDSVVPSATVLSGRALVEIDDLRRENAELRARLAKQQAPVPSSASAATDSFRYESSPAGLGRQAGDVKNASLAFYKKYHGRLPTESDPGYPEFIADLDELLTWNVTTAALTELRFAVMNPSEQGEWAAAMVSRSLALDDARRLKLQALYSEAYAAGGKIRFNENGAVGDPRAGRLAQAIAPLFTEEERARYAQIVGPIWLPNDDLLVTFDTEGKNMSHWLYDAFRRRKRSE